MNKTLSMNYVNGNSAMIAEKLFAASGYPLLSLYMPTHRAGSDVWQNPIRFKNLVRAAQHDLERSGLEPGEIRRFLRPLLELQEDREFWQKQADGLAIFHSASGMETIPLPASVPEVCVVSERFHVKPLLMTLSDDKTFFVLALSQNSARLFRGSAWGLKEVEGLEFPEALDEKLAGAERTMQSHSAGAGSRIVHSIDLDRKTMIGKYCRKVDQAIHPVVGDGGFLILAAVDYMAGIYREVTSLKGLAEDTLNGNFDASAPAEIFERSLPIAERYFERRIHEANRRFKESLREGHALENPMETIAAARQGRVETLFVPVGVHIWGERSESGELKISSTKGPNTHDLLNDAVFDTWKSGGHVLALSPEDMPGGRQVAAITRF